MTTKKIYGPWIKWRGGGECHVPPDTVVKVRYRDGGLESGHRADEYRWLHGNGDIDIVEYCAVIEQADLDAAEQLLRANGYTVTRPLTFEDVKPLTEAPQEGTDYWVLSAEYPAGVLSVWFSSDEFDGWAIKHW